MSAIQAVLRQDGRQTEKSLGARRPLLTLTEKDKPLRLSLKQGGRQAETGRCLLMSSYACLSAPYSETDQGENVRERGPALP